MRYIFILSLLSSLLMATAGQACAERGQCDPLKDNRYEGGGYTPEVVPTVACLPRVIYEAIRLADGSSAWAAGFYYGSHEPEVVTTVRNERCWSRAPSGAKQHMPVGAWVVVYITCDEYTGWLGGKVDRSGLIDLQPVKLPTQHDPMR